MIEGVEVEELRSVLGVLTALVTPALLISASGSLIVSTSNRLSNNTERARRIVASLRKLEGGSPGPPARDRRHLEMQLQVTYHRVSLQQAALTLFYAASVMFVACSLVLGVEAIVPFKPLWLPIALGLVGVMLLLIACMLLILDVRYLVRLLRHDVGTLGSPAASRGA